MDISAQARRLLLVEDEPIIAMAQRYALESMGYHVTHAHSGEDAMSAMQASPDTIDLILMDIDLGRGMDGASAALAILGMRELPIVFLSSHTERDVVERTEGISSYGYVVKSAGITVLDACIRMAFRLFEARRALAETNADLRVVADTLGMALDAAMLGTWRNDLLTGLVYLDARGLQHYGFESSPIRIEDVVAHVHPADSERLMAEIGSATNPHEGDGRFHTRYRVIHPDNSVHVLEVRVRVHFAGDGAVRHPIVGFGTSRDLGIEGAPGTPGISLHT